MEEKEVKVNWGLHVLDMAMVFLISFLTAVSTTLASGHVINIIDFLIPIPASLLVAIIKFRSFVDSQINVIPLMFI